MIFLFIAKLFLAWVIIDLLLLCFLLLATPSTESALSSRAGAQRASARITCGESEFLQQREEATPQRNELTDAELLRRLRAATIDSTRLVTQARTMISQSRDLLDSSPKINGPLIGSSISI